MADGNEINVEMLTVRRILNVEPSWLGGSPDRVRVDVCVKCGAVVFDVVGHDLWHRGEQR